MTDDLQHALATVGSERTDFGSGVQPEKLWKYHYVIPIQHFTDPITLNTYSSFDEGLKTIETNFASNVAHTKLVYKLVFTEQKTAGFGIAQQRTRRRVKASSWHSSAKRRILRPCRTKSSGKANR